MTLLRSGRSRWRVPLVTVGAGAAPAALALALTAGRAPLRTLAGLFFLAALVPALQLVAGAFFGWPAALATGIAVAALTLWQTFTPPRPMVVQPTQWPAGFTAPDQSYQSTLRPPPGARAAAALQGGGRATLGVCLARGTGEDLEVLFGG